MSFYNELRRRISRRHHLPDVLKDFVDRLEYIDRRSAGEEVLDPHPPSQEFKLSAITPIIAPTYTPKKQPVGRLTHYRRAREGDRSSIEWLIGQHNSMLMTRDQDLVKAITHVENLLPFAQVSKMKTYVDTKSKGLRERDAICDSAQDFLNAEDDEL